MSRFVPSNVVAKSDIPLVELVEGYARHWCPGCDDTHLIPLPRWNFNGSLTAPTFTPSVRITWGLAPGSRQCHYNITDGAIYFHGDSTHKLAGQNVALPPIPADE